jgi:hypothetical protein
MTWRKIVYHLAHDFSRHKKNTRGALGLRMNDPELKAAAKATAAQVVNPLASLFLEVGLGGRDFQEVSRMQFVEAAVAKGKAASPPATSDSAIAAVTGFTRRDVARLRKLSAKTGRRKQIAQHRVEQVFNAWRHDPEFQDDSGNPARLSLSGKGKAFNALVRKHSADPRPRTILRELERVKAVRRNPDGTVELIRKTYAPPALSLEGINDIGQHSRDQLVTMLHNLFHPKRQLYQRHASNRSLTENQAAILMRHFAQQGDALMDSLASMLSDPPADLSKSGNKKRIRLAIGLYLGRDPIEAESEPKVTRDVKPTERTRQQNTNTASRQRR